MHDTLQKIIANIDAIEKAIEAIRVDVAVHGATISDIKSIVLGSVIGIFGIVVTVGTFVIVQIRKIRKENTDRATVFFGHAEQERVKDAERIRTIDESNKENSRVVSMALNEIKTEREVRATQIEDMKRFCDQCRKHRGE